MAPDPWRRFLDAESGNLPWQFNADHVINATPVTYTIDGAQYIAIAAGGNSLFGYRTGDKILVFRLAE